MMEKGWLMPSFFVMRKVFQSLFLYLNLFFYVTTGEKLSGMRISFCRRISSAKYLLRMIVNNYKFVFSIEIGESFPDRP